MVSPISQSDVNAMKRWRHASELPIDKEMLKMSRSLTRALVLQPPSPLLLLPHFQPISENTAFTRSIALLASLLVLQRHLC